MAMSGTGTSVMGEFRWLRIDADPGGVRVLSLDRPPVNALGRELVEELAQGLARLTADEHARCLIVRSAGKHFCAGSRLSLLEATVALDALLDRLPGLRADPQAEPSRVVGIAFRGPDQLRVRFDSGH